MTEPRPFHAAVENAVRRSQELFRLRGLTNPSRDDLDRIAALEAGEDSESPLPAPMSEGEASRNKQLAAEAAAKQPTSEGEASRNQQLAAEAKAGLDEAQGLPKSEGEASRNKQLAEMADPAYSEGEASRDQALKGELDKLLAIADPTKEDLARIAELRDEPDDSLPHPDTTLAYLLGPNHTVSGIKQPAAEPPTEESPVRAAMKSLDVAPAATDNRMKSLFKTATGTPFDPNSSADRKRWAELKSFLAEVPESDSLSDVKLALKFYTKQANAAR
jgi:hypothetical protein